MPDGGNEQEIAKNLGVFQGAVLSRLDSIERTLNEMKQEAKEFRIELATKSALSITEDHGKRIEALEKWRWMLGGALILAGTIGGMFGNLIFETLTKG